MMYELLAGDGMKKIIGFIVLGTFFASAYGCPSRIKNDSDAAIGIAIKNKNHRIPVAQAQKFFELMLDAHKGMPENVTVDPSKYDQNNHTFFIYKQIGDYFEAQYKVRYLYCGTGVNKTIIFTFSDTLGVTDQTGKPLEAPVYKAQFEVTRIEKRCPSTIKNASAQTVIAIAEKKSADIIRDTPQELAELITLSPGQQVEDVDPSMHDPENHILYVYKKIADKFEKQYSITYLYCATKEESTKNNKNIIITYSDDFGITDQNHVPLEAPGLGEQFKVDAFQVSDDEKNEQPALAQTSKQAAEQNSGKI